MSARILQSKLAMAHRSAGTSGWVGDAAADRSRPRLMRKIRRTIGGFGVLVLLTFAGVHWIAQDLEAAILAPRLPRAELKHRVTDALARLNLVLLLAGAATAPVLGGALWLVAGFVARHFAEVEAASRAKSQLVRWVAHELRTPLNGIKGFADLLGSGGRGPLAPGQSECVQEIRGGVAHMKTMINDLLDLARIESGAVDLRPEETTVAALVADLQGIAGPIAAARGVRLVPSGRLDAPLWADYQRAKQALLNLLSNAVKFSPEGGEVRIVATCRGSGVCVAVQDDGPGMTAAEAAGLFAEFSQTRTGRQAVEGSGLGLAISRKLAVMMGGALEVRVEPGQGACFELVLPAGAPGGAAPGAMLPLAAERA